MNKRIENELKKYQLKYNKYEVISDANGILVARIFNEDSTCILKILPEQFRRELDIYRLFEQYKIKTIEVIAKQKNSILLVDINASDKYRLATIEDMKSVTLMKSLKQWYQHLHQEGINILLESKLEFYSEVEEITQQTLDYLQEKTKYSNQEFWHLLKENLQLLKDYVKFNQTITYNDFNYTNMIVAKDHSEAFMFDYNFVGVGLRTFDVRNISKNQYFDSSAVPLFDYENCPLIDRKIDHVLSHLFGLLKAYQASEFPWWAEESLSQLTSNQLYNSLIACVDEFNAHAEVEYLRLTREDLVIRNARVSDIDQLSIWWRDGSVMDHAGFPLGLDFKESDLKRKYLVRNVSKKSGRLVVESNSKAIGEMSFRLIGKNCYEIGIKICDVSHQNHGVGSTCLMMLFDHLFYNLDATRIHLDTSMKNVRAQKVYKRLGFKQTKVTENGFKDQIGRYRTVVEFDLSLDDYEKAKNILLKKNSMSINVMTEDEAIEVTKWDYDGKYKMYNLPSWDDMLKKNFIMTSERGRQNYFTFRVAGDIVGFINLLERNEFIFLGIGVNPENVGSGYGTAMMQLAIKKCREIYNGKKIRLEVRSWNQRAIKCYQNVGFTVTETINQTTYIGPGEFARMELEHY